MLLSESAREMSEPLPKEVLWNKMESLDDPDQKEETACWVRKEYQQRKL